MANELRVSITADTSGLDAGLSAATAQVKTAAETMAEAQNAAAAATKNLAQAQAQLGAAAVAGNAQAKNIIAQYQAELATAKAQVVQLTAAETEQTAATVELTGATQAATAADTEFAVAQEKVTTSTGHVRGSLYAAQGAAALLEGRIPIRAMERFLVSSNAVAGALQVAFPIIGAVAIGELLIDLGKSAYNLYEKFIDISSVDDKILEDFRKMQESDIFNVRSIETAKLRLDDAAKSATNLRDVANELHNISLHAFFADLVSGNLTAATADIGQLAAAKKLADEGGKQREISLKLTLEQIKLEHELTLQKIETSHAADGLLSKEQQITAEHAKRLAIIKENQSFSRREEMALGNKSPQDSGSEMASLQRAQADREEQVALSKIKDDTVKQFVAESISDYRREAQAKKALDAEVTEVLENSLHEQLTAQKEEEKQEEGAQRLALEHFKWVQQQKVAAAEQAHQEIVGAMQEKAANVSAEESLGQVKPQVALTALRTLHAQQIQEEQRFIREMEAIESTEPEKVRQLELQMSQVRTKGNIQWLQDTERISKQIEQHYKAVFDTIGRGFQTALNGWLQGTQTAQQAFARMFDSVLIDLADFVAKWLEKKAVMWLTENAMQAAGLATSKGLQDAANSKEIMSDAKTAAANTYKAVSAIPYVGPFLAPPAAAAAFAAVMAFDSFADGGVVQGASGMPVMIQAHAGERVLSAGQTQNFENMVNSSQRSSRNTLNYSPTIYGKPDKDMLDGHTQQIMGMMRRMIRPEAFA